MFITPHSKNKGSSAIDNFNKLATQKKEMAKKMKRGPYDHHAKPSKALTESELNKVKEMTKGMPSSYYFDKLKN